MTSVHLFWFIIHIAFYLQNFNISCFLNGNPWIFILSRAKRDCKYIRNYFISLNADFLFVSFFSLVLWRFKIIILAIIGTNFIHLKAQLIKPWLAKFLALNVNNLFISSWMNLYKNEYVFKVGYSWFLWWKLWYFRLVILEKQEEEEE